MSVSIDSTSTGSGLPESFHLIGIGGSGMSVVARLLAAQGAVVSGSDRQDSDFLKGLQEIGIDAYFPHGKKDFDPNATVVLSSAIRPDNIELVTAKERGQRVIHRSEALALAARGQEFIAVAGAHGKTTTSAMIAVALLESGVDASFAIGGSVTGVGSGARSGRDIFVAEADESDGSFLNYSPSIALVTNIEADHLDTHGSAESLFHVFESFVDRIVPGGSLICCGEDPGSARLAAEMRERTDLKVLTYGRPDRCADAPDVRLESVQVLRNGIEAELASSCFSSDFARVPLTLQVTGEHNAVNAAGAWTTCVAAGVPLKTAAESLASFRGADRRFDFQGTVAGRTLINDYAHHPTEVAAAIHQAQLVADGGDVVVVFQPHLYSRTKSFADRFAQALAEANGVVLADIYAAREDPMDGVTSALIEDAAPPGVDFVNAGPVATAARLGAELTKPGDVMVLMGAGDIYLEAGPVLEAWAGLETDASSLIPGGGDSSAKEAPSDAREGRR